MSGKFVVLFDIDGTLLSTSATEEDEGRRYVETIRAVVGKEPRVIPSRFAGMVDPQICRILLTELGLSEEETSHFLPEVLRRMGEDYRTMRKRIVLNSGVTGLLAILAMSPIHVTGALTGNLVAVADEKLKRASIRDYFLELYCADNYFDRTRLVEDAVRQCMSKYHLDATQNVLIVGDTPRDVVAANAGHATPIGIAAGVYSFNQLEEAGAAHVYPNLEPTKALLEGLRA